MKKSIVTIVVALALYAISQFQGVSQPQTASDDVFQQAFENRQSDLQVRGSAVVEKILPDDNKGSRHQRFIVRLASGQKLLVAHNIDLAPRINALRERDHIEFYGEYEWNDKGGVSTGPTMIQKGVIPEAGLSMMVKLISRVPKVFA